MKTKTLVVWLSVLLLQTQVFSASSKAVWKKRQEYRVEAIVFRHFLKDFEASDAPIFLSVGKKQRNPHSLVYEWVGYKETIQPISKLASFRKRWYREWVAKGKRKDMEGIYHGARVHIQGLKWLTKTRISIIAWVKYNPAGHGDYGIYKQIAFQLQRRHNQWHLTEARSLVVAG